MDTTPSDAVFLYLHELSSRVVAESGIATDKHHLGKILLRCMKESPDFIMQIDAATDEKETFKSVMDRSIRCASALTNLGLKHQDVILFMAPNHLDLTIPMYAALYLGIGAACIDKNLGTYELERMLKYVEPKVIFCENSNVNVIEEALKSCNTSPHIVTFGEKLNHQSFAEFLENYSDAACLDNFRPADFDPSETIAFLAATSGTTAAAKLVALTHKNIFIGGPGAFLCCTKYPSPFKAAMILSPIQWISSILQFIILTTIKITRVQTSMPITLDHVFSLINKYKPEFTITGPTFMKTLLKSANKESCDFSCFKYLILAGSVMPVELVDEIKQVAPNAVIKNIYGISEVSGSLTNPTITVKGSLGMPQNSLQIKLIHPDTKEVINEPNVPGELYVKGPTVFKEYYNNPELTAQALEDGWFKTGDIIYRDEHYQLYFVDRLKSLLKYKNHQISPLEIESVIMKHPGVLDVAVSGIPDDECGDLPVAFVVPRDGCNVTEQEIKHLVAASLSDTKQLRGGVVFLKEMPVNAISKINRQQLKKMAASMKKQ